MIPVHGPDWPGTRALREALAAIPNPNAHEIHWGTTPCDKLEALRRWRAAGLYTPIFTTSAAEAEDWLHWGLQVWGRRTRHSQGRDISSNPRSHKWHTSDFYVQIVPSVAYEVRVHVWAGRAFRFGIKQWQGSGPQPTGRNVRIRAAKRGWELCYSQATLDKLLPERKPLREAAKAAVAALGVQGGAVDLLLTRSGDIYLLELNTAPSLGDNTLQAYVEHISAWAAGVQAKGANA